MKHVPDPLQSSARVPGLFDSSTAPRRPSYVPQRGDLVLTPERKAGIVTDAKPNWVAPTVVSVFAGGIWLSYDPMQLTPWLDDEPRPRAANFAGLLSKDLESFAPGFRSTTPAMCHECDGLDVELVNVDGRELCPQCVAELAARKTP